MACSPRPVEWGWTGTGVDQYTMPAILSFSLIEAGIILCASGSHKLPLLTLSLCDKTVGVCPVALTRNTQSCKLSALSLLHTVACSEAKKYSFRYERVTCSFSMGCLEVINRWMCIKSNSEYDIYLQFSA